MNRTIADSFTLRDALAGVVVTGASDEEISREFAEFFSDNPGIRRPFENVFREMMHDTTHTFSDKCSFFLERDELPEDEARRQLEEIWVLATGTEWKA